MAERTPVLSEQEDQFTSFLRDVYSSTPEEDAQFQRFAAGENAPQLPTAPGNLQEVFSAGIESGVQGLAADLEYFKALGNTLMGDEQAAALNIQEARLREEFAAAPVQGLDTFEQFLDQPTFGGFIEQATKSFGQVLPSAALSIAGAGTGAITAAVGRGVLNQVNKQVAKRIIKDSVERTANGVADPVEQQIAELAYGSLRTAAKRGAVGGAFAAEYAPMSGSNLSEALEAGQPLDQANALRAAAIGIPQAAIGVGSEYALLKLIGEQATKRAAVEGGVFANFAKRLGTGALQGGAIEATTEVAQEGISVANRADLDPLFTAEDAKMRLAEAAFAGFFGGAAPGGAGGAIGGTLDAVSSMKPGQGALTTIGNVVEKAKELLDTARGQRVDQQINNEQFGDVASGLTTPESEGDIDAQLRAMADSTSGKKSVWIAGVGPRFDAPRNRVKTAFVDGVKAYSSFIPGRGTIISTDEDIVREVIAAGASDKALQIALGYSAVKDYSTPSDIVVQALDRNGRVISEEVTSPEGVSAAFEAARNLMPKGGSIQQTTVEKALEDRKRRFESEQRVEIREMNVEEDQDGTEDQTDIDLFAQGSQTIQGQRNEIGVYKKKDPAATFANTAEARANYERVFGDTDWTSPRFASMSEQMLNTAASRQSNNPNVAVIIEDTPDGKFRLVEEEYGQEDKFRFTKLVKDKETGRESTQTLLLNLSDYLVESVRRAYRVAGDLTFSSKKGDNRSARLSPEFSRLRRDSQRVTVVSPNGRAVNVALWDLVNSGRGLLFGRGQSMLGVTDARGRTISDPKAAARDAFSTLLADMLLQGYDIQVDGKSISNAIPDSALDVTAWLDGKRPVSLGELLQRDDRLPSGKRLLVFRSEEEAAVYEGRLPLGRGEKRPAPFNRLTGLTASQLATQQRSYAERGYATIVEIEEDFDPTALEDNAAPTEPNEDLPDTSIDARTTPSTVRTIEEAPLSPREQAVVSGAVNSMVQGVIQDLLAALNFKNPPRIYTFAQLDGMTQEQLVAEFQGAFEYVQTSLNSLRQNRSNFGRHVSGPYGNVIIYRETNNPLQDALVVAHELGHSLYKEERDKALQNKALRDRLFNAYKASPTFKGLKERYGFDRGFEEWFSDQVALWANQRYKNKQPQKLGDRFFRDFVNRLRGLWRVTSESFRKRFSQRLNEDFETFMDAVLESRKSQVKENGLSFTEKAFVYELNELNIENGGAARAAHWQSKISQLKKSPYVKPILRLISTADGILRMYAGNEIADMFYVRAQDPTGKGRLGFVPQSARTFDLYKNRLDAELGSFDDPALDAEFDKAASDTPTAQLTGKALAIRQFLEDFYSEYVSPSKTKIGFQRDYFPRLLDLVAISNDPQAFIDLILQADPSADRAKITRRVEKLVDLQQAVTNGANVEGNPLDPAASVNEALELTKNLTREQLRDNGFLLPPKQAFSEYVRKVIKRVEFDRATKDDQGNDRLKPLLDALAPEDREQALQVINTYMGYRAPLSPFWRKLNSWGQFIQFVTILPFAAISSVTDLAGPIIASKEFGDLTTGMKEVVATIKNREEAKQLARDIGVVTPEAVANAWITDADADYMDPTARKWSDHWFSLTGLNWFTRFTREFATGMGVQFITKHARNEFNNPRSDRYLEELGLTRADVTSWLNSGRKLSTPEGKKVTQALQRFVESSTLRPNAAERPMWASDPHYALIWQLKGYFYSYGKVILGGMFSEAETRLREQNIGTPWQRVGSAAGLLALTAVATMPLAMLGMELREYAKFGLAAFLPFVEADQKYFKTDRMDWAEYLGTAFERSNFSGPFGLATSASAAANFGDSPLATLLGPTTETIDTAMTNGWRIDRTLKDRLLPFYNQL